MCCSAFLSFKAKSCLIILTIQIGNGMSPVEDRTHFTMWCMMVSPLILGNDLRKMSKETLSIITNKVGSKRE